ncbi:TPR repeat protein [Roseimicrobium gellanilyticum]|uniref:TPR repeat protein n=1 Tax=Roseimicrobium gellanilyticum TaxID=748857 RepID=A0A366HUE9_9BACT|nr:CHAT domain-containing protein [Roseimicrobium gellanilyticum]RBP46534.1 TPR repeat protein [Roseimicrobium gellanilyticum]
MVSLGFSFKAVVMVSALGLDTAVWKAPSPEVVAQVQALADATDAAAKGKPLSSEKNVEAVTEKIRALAEKGDRDAQFAAGVLLRKENPQGAIQYFRLAAAQGQLLAMNGYGWHLVSAMVPDEKRSAEGLNLLQEASDAGVAEATRNLASVYLMGLGGVSQDTKKAEALFEMAAARGDSEAALELYKLYSTGLHGTQNVEQATKWLLRAVDGGNPTALGLMDGLFKEADSHGIAAVTAPVLSQFETLAARSDPIGLRTLGKIYEEGLGGKPKDVERALQYYAKAAAANDVLAQAWLAEFYRNGEVVEANPEAAFQLYTLAARNNLPEASYHVASFYEHGYGVEMNKGTALVQYRRAANLGSPHAMYRMGAIYLYGDGTKKNVGEAAGWFKKSTAAGLAEANLGLGEVWEKGTEQGKPDVQMAARCYLTLADASGADAKFRSHAMARLGSLYGRAAIKSSPLNPNADFERAYLCAALAEKLDPDNPTAIDTKIFASKQMTLAQKSEVQRMVVMTETKNVEVETILSAPVQNELERTPHLEVLPDRQLKTGANLQVQAYLDTEISSAKEDVTPVIVSLKRQVDSVDLKAVLVSSPHFKLRKGTLEEKITLWPSEAKSTVAQFEVEVEVIAPPKEQLWDPPFLQVIFYNEAGFKVGSVRRQWDSAGNPMARDDAPATPSPAPAKTSSEGPKVNVRGVEADLFLEIIRTGPGAYKFVVASPHCNPASKEATWTTGWQDDAKEFVDNHVAGILNSRENVTPEKRLAALKQLGIDCYSLSPEIFRNVVADLVEKKKLRSIFITSEEPVFPWEMVYLPDPEDSSKWLEPLGVQAVVGRWTTDVRKNFGNPAGQLELEKSFVVVGPFGDGSGKFAREEANEVLKSKGSEEIKPATRATLEKKLANGSAGILHFICHGQTEQKEHRLQLNDGYFDPSYVRANGAVQAYLAGKERCRLVFINACQAAGSSEVLGGIGGFPSAFISTNAGAVIAPIWTVGHESARDASVQFYKRIQSDPSIPLAEIVRDIRAQAYRPGPYFGDPTFAAYFFYGSPTCVKYRPPPSPQP